MRIKFKSKPKIVAQIGDRRIVNKFLWSPKIINRELRWLEETTWVEECYQKGHLLPGTHIWFHTLEWRSISWYDEGL